MKATRRLLFAISLLSTLTSCETMLEIMAAGLMGGMGMGYMPYYNGIGTGAVPSYYNGGYITNDNFFTPSIQTPLPMTTPIYSGGYYVDDSSSSTSTSNSSDRPQLNNSSKDCPICHGSGKCNTCNGKGYYTQLGVGSGTHPCPNCNNHNGLCSSCNGTGKVSTIAKNY